MQGSKKPIVYKTGVASFSDKIPRHLSVEFMDQCANMIPQNNHPILLTHEKEVFLRQYVQHQNTRGHSTKSYIIARGLDPEAWDKTSKKREITDRHGKTRYEDIPMSSEFDKKMHIVRTTATKWLNTPTVNARRMQLTNEMLKDYVVDNEMMKVLTQDKDLTAKNTAIREFNKLKGRIVDRKDVRTQSVGIVKHLYEESDDIFNSMLDDHNQDT